MLDKLSTPSQVWVLALGCLACRPPSPPAEPNTASASPTPADASASEDPAPMSADDRLDPGLRAYLEAREAELDAVAEERREALGQLAAFVAERRAAGEPAQLLFICTHNSRRSHMGQLWAAAAAAYYGVEGVESYSGGTEATAFNPRAVAAMRRAGFAIAEPPAGEDNPRYEVRLAEGGPAMLAFSKTWRDPVNPSEGFAAVMTCSQADEACPFVRGSKLRVALPYEDPKLADDTPEEAARYDARARQIAVEMLYLFRQVAAAEAG